MKDSSKIKFICSGILFVLFCALIFAVKFVDVRAIGPESSSIGLAAINEAVHDFFGVNLVLYKITNILGYAAIAVAGCFALFGIYQLVTRRSFKKVDPDIYVLVGCYAAAVLIYIFFEYIIINYRPVDMGSGLEASFPSSHTVLSLCIMSTAIDQFFHRIKSRPLSLALCCSCGVRGAVTVVGRLVSGVHWVTDILGGVLISGAVLLLYLGLCEKLRKSGRNSQ